MQNFSFNKNSIVLTVFCISIALLAILTLFANKYMHHPKDREEIQLLNTAPKVVKVAPSHPSGEEIPHADKTVFQILNKKQR